MKRFDYHQPLLERFAGIAPAALIDGRRSVLIAIAVSAILLALTTSIELQRLSRLNGELTDLQTHVRSARAQVQRASLLIAANARARRIDERVRSARQEAIASTNAIARLGNALPARTWLTAIQSAPGGTWTISGRSDRVAEIGTTLRTLATFDARATPQLISISSGGPGGTLLDFAIGWQRR